VPARRRRAASIFAEALQVSLADGLELACTLALQVAESYRDGRIPDQGAVQALEEFAVMVTKAKESALEEARQRRLDGQG
jgi:hypothetical protein